jgi:hypothetical protein
MKIQSERWTPDRATQVLEAQKRIGWRNPRGLREHRVNVYAREMKAGRWRQNGETISFNGEKLLNGWHRMNAIVASGVTLDLFVARGVDVEAISTMDVGLIRGATDLISMRGFSNASQVAAAGRLALTYLRYHTVATDPDKNVTPGEVDDWVVAHPEVSESVAFWKNTTGSRHITAHGSAMAAFHWLCGRRHSVERDAFFTDLINGVNLGTTQPVRVLRERLIADRASSAKLPRLYVCAITVKSWNAELRGEPVKLLRYNRDNESFPLLMGDES